VTGALVVGGDGLIGGELVRQLRDRSWEVVGTRHRTVTDAEVAFDLADDPAVLLNTPPVRRLRFEQSWVVFLAAAVTGYARCEQDPVATRRINVNNAVKLTRTLVQSAAFVVYPSSSAIFGEATGRRDESSFPSATSEYGRQKADAEQGMLRLVDKALGKGGVAVTRLTKVVAARGVVGQWIETLRAGGVIEAAMDLLLCPISLPFVAHGLIAIAATGRSGVYHLSGENVISYFEFAMRLADALGAKRSQVRPVEIGPSGTGAPAGGIKLEMRETEKHARLSPQAFDSVLLDLVSSI
jgi:dTDP-4-dehydrorhamnose reductase